MKVFKKTALLLTVIVLAVVLSIGVIAGVAHAAEGNATLGEVYSGVQVTTDGKVNLKVFYSDLGSATGFKVEVVDPDTGKTDKVMNNVVAEASGDKYVVKVPLTPSQMTHTVKVTATAGDAASTAMEFSVAEYAQEVLATEGFADYHDAMRMLLNWGAMAQNFFGDATETLANTNVFARGTNPMGVVGADSIAFPARENDDLAFTEANIELSHGTIAMNFEINLGTEVAADEIAAMYFREGLDDWVEIEVKETANAGIYSLSIRNISVGNWGTIYTVYVVAGEGEYIQDYSVLEYLDTMITLDNYTAEQKNVARSMYQFYQAATGNTGVETCDHGRRNTIYWANVDADSAVIKCAFCHAQLSNVAVNNAVNEYIPGSLLQFGSKTGSTDVTVMQENGEQFVRVDNMWANREGWGDIGLTGLLSSNTTTGQYMVIKLRVGAAGNGTNYIEGYFNTNNTSEKNLVSDGMVSMGATNDGEWHTIIVDLASDVRYATDAFAPAEDGSYDIQYLSLRLFPSASTDVKDDSAEGRYVYVYKYTTSDNKTAYDTFTGAKLTDDELAAKVEEHADYALYEIRKMNMSAEAYVDVAYVAFSESLDAIKSLIDTKIYEEPVFTTSEANNGTTDKPEMVQKNTRTGTYYYNTIDDSCAHVGRNMSETLNGSTYTYGVCGQCGDTYYTKTLADSVKLYFAPYRMSSQSAGTPTNPRVIFQVGGTQFNVEPGDAYVRFLGSEAPNKEGVILPRTAQIIWNRGPDVNGYEAGNAQDYTMDIGKANYAVIKMRVNETFTNNPMFMYSTTGIDKEATITLPTNLSTPGQWATYVVDLSRAAGAQHKADDAGNYAIDTFYFHLQAFAVSYKLDVGSVAFVEGDWAEVAKAIETKTALYTYASGKAVEVDAATGACTGNHLGSLQVIGGVYNYVCDICGNVRDCGVKADAANVFWSAETLYVKGTELGSNASDYASTTGKYNYNAILTEDGETFYRMGDAESNHSTKDKPWGGWYPIASDGARPLENSGRYMVFKVRQNQNEIGATTMNMFVASTKSGKSWADGSFIISLPADGQWHVIVIDLATRSGKFEANDDGTYSVRTIHLRPFNGGNGPELDAHTDETLDFAYWAFFDDLNDLKDIIKEDTYEFSKSSSMNAVYDTETHACVGSHVYKETVNGTTHTVKCEDCGYVAKTYEVPAEINYYTDLSIMAPCGSTLTTYKWDDAEKIFYNNFTATGGCHFDLTGGDAGTAGTWTTGTYDSGKYVVIKYRSNVTEQMYVGTKDTGTLKGQNNPNRESVGQLTPSATWKVQVFEIPDNCASYTVNTQQNLYFMVGSQPGSFDVAYLAVVDDVDEAILLLGENETFYLGDSHLDKNKQCVGACNYVYTEDATATNGYVYACPVCGGTNDINFYKNSFSGGYNSSATKMDGFTRFTFSASGHLNLSYSETETRGGMPSKEQVVAGQYLAIKFRADLTSSLQIRIGNTNEFAANGWNYAMNDAGSIKPAYVTGDEWRILVIDLSNFNDAEYEIGKKNGILLSTQGGGATTMDVAWVAVGDSIEELKSLFTADDTTYYDFGTSYSNVPSHKNLDGSCAEHAYDPSTEPSTRTEGENTVYYYTCTVCGQEAWSRTVAAGTTVIDHLDMKTPVNNVNKNDTTISTHFCMTNVAVVKEDNPYFSFEGNDQAHKTCIFIWTRSLVDNGENQTTTHEQYSIDVGEARFLVIKMRANIAGVSPSGFNFKISTTGAEKNDTFRLPADQFKGEWITMVFDLETACTKWVKDETTGHYLVDSFWFSVSPVLTSDSIDIEYMAFVEGDWSDVDTIVEEETVISMTTPGTNNYDIVYVADGSKKD